MMSLVVLCDVCGVEVVRREVDQAGVKSHVEKRRLTVRTRGGDREDHLVVCDRWSCWEKVEKRVSKLASDLNVARMQEEARGAGGSNGAHA